MCTLFRRNLSWDSGKEVTEMLTNMKKGLLAAAVLTLAPVAPLLVGSASNAEAHTYVSGSVSFGTPVAVVNTVAVSVARRRSEETTRSGENLASTGTANRA